MLSRKYKDMFSISCTCDDCGGTGIVWEDDGNDGEVQTVCVTCGGSGECA